MCIDHSLHTRSSHNGMAAASGYLNNVSVEMGGTNISSKCNFQLLGVDLEAELLNQMVIPFVVF